MLIIIRHALAEDRTVFAQSRRPDSERPLAETGFLRMAAACDGLRHLAPTIATLACSPWTRARQTADIVATAYGGGNVVETAALIPTHGPDELLTWVRSRLPAGPVAVVGHEPHLGTLIGLALHGRSDMPVPLKKGGACALAFGPRVAAGKARMLWYMAPRELRRIGEGKGGIFQ